MLTAERLRELLSYDAATGLFTWRAVRKRCTPGKPAGCVARGPGYRVIRVDGVLYGAHRLAWLYVYGVLPENHIDHINGDPTDNRVHNLREATSGENQQNLRKAKGARDLPLGVSPHKGRWSARITLNRKQWHIGVFDSPEEAHRAYLRAKRSAHPFGEIAK